MLIGNILYFIVCVPLVFGEPRKNAFNVIGGSAARKHLYSYQVSLQNFNGHFCGGSIISEQCVLTAAHCIIYPIKQFVVRVGATDLKDKGTFYDIQSVIIHPEHAGNGAGSDIAVIKVYGPIKFNEFVQPIKLANTYPKSGEMATLTGWGYTDPEPKTQILPDQLQAISVRILSLAECKKYNPIDLNYPNDLVTDRHVCTLNKFGEGVCQGDSGGALVSENKEQIGIVSFTAKRCAIDKPDAYTCVPCYRRWIKECTGV